MCLEPFFFFFLLPTEAATSILIPDLETYVAEPKS